MCGIVGAINISNLNIKQTLQTLIHRGPDSDGYFWENNVFLGHTRLSILDLSERGNQPMTSDDGRFLITYNGEIYNHLEIRNNKLSHVNFHSNTDTETILKAYQAYGKECLDFFNGIFSFCIFDKRKNSFFLARDHIGVKPLYYKKEGNYLIFSSEIKALLNFPFEKEIDFEAMKNYVTFNWSPGEKSPVKNLYKLRPGNFIEFDLDEKDQIKDFSLKHYYSVPTNGTYSRKTEEDLIEEVDNRLRLAVDRQMLSDAPLGFFLSGGLDSSLLVAMARDLYPEKEIPCFTIDTGEESKDGFARDYDFAKKVAEDLNVELNVIEANPDIVQDFDKMIWYLDEPQADPAPLNVLKICDLAREKGIKVLISGTGGDDIFSGYRRHPALRFEGLFNIIPYFVRKPFKNTISKLPVHRPSIRRFKKLFTDIDQSSKDRLIGYYKDLPDSIVNKLFSNQNQNIVKSFNTNAYFYDLLDEIPNEKSILNQSLYLDQYSFLVDHNLNYMDKMGMAKSVEIRVPFLDLDLLNFVGTIPPKLKMNGITTKYILKKVAERYLTKDVIYRPKTGFGFPLDHWVKNDLSEMINDRLSFDKLGKEGIFNPSKVRELVEKNRNEEISASYPIWCLLAIQSWIDQFYKN